MNWITTTEGHIEWEAVTIPSMPPNSRMKYRVFLKDQNSNVVEKGRTTALNFTFSNVSETVSGFSAGVQAGLYMGEEILIEGEITWSDLEGIPEPFKFTPYEVPPKVQGLRATEGNG